MPDKKLTFQEEYKLDIVLKALQTELSSIEAVKLLGISRRQLQRLKNAVAYRGRDAVIHGLKGKKSNRQ